MTIYLTAFSFFSFYCCICRQAQCRTETDSRVDGRKNWRVRRNARTCYFLGSSSPHGRICDRPLWNTGHDFGLENLLPSDNLWNCVLVWTIDSYFFDNFFTSRQPRVVGARSTSSPSSCLFAGEFGIQCGVRLFVGAGTKAKQFLLGRQGTLGWSSSDCSIEGVGNPGDPTRRRWSTKTRTKAVAHHTIQFYCVCVYVILVGD